jgi:hypothetical protein
MRKLNIFEKKNTNFLALKGIEYSLLEPTATGMKKSIMDATTPVRVFLKESELHNYEEQPQGQEHKHIIKANIVDMENHIPTIVSLYRPNTKMGDPRIWISKLPQYASMNEIIVLLADDRELVAINITRIDLYSLYECNMYFESVIDRLAISISVAEELLQKLKMIARDCPIRADHSDTMIGRLLESLLGISMNSSKNPDYKGIEIKSYREYQNGRGNRINLFASVADWDLSPFKSSRDILDNFGYMRGDVKKLYCTVSTQNFNSQGLSFKIDNRKDWLIEYCNDNKIGDVAVWALGRLHSILKHKHNATFWVSANSTRIDNYEEFTYTSVLHTQKPIPSQFDLMLSQGDITMDHLIKRDRIGRVVEKGPLFKLYRHSLKDLFPEVGYYEL